MSLRGRKISAEPEEPQTVEINAQMHGSLTFKDPVSLKINGEFTGTLEAKGNLSIGARAVVEANIIGDNIVIAGKIKGDVVAHKMLTLMPSAVVKGNISTPKLNIVEGAIFQGNCQMIEAENTLGNEELLDINEVAKYLEIDLREIEALANSGKIPGRKTGNLWKFERGQIDHWASSGKVK